MSDERFTIESARGAAEGDRLSEWVADFLASDGSDNAELGEQLHEEYPMWFGPVKVPFDRMHRLAGPPDQPTLERLDDEDIETVESMEKSIDDGWTPPPFVATWQGDHIMLEDGNHRAEGVRRAGDDGYWCVIGVHTNDERRAAEALIDS